MPFVMDALYQEKILAYAKASRKNVPPADANYTAAISNPTCGDRVELSLSVNGDGIVEAAGAIVRGCALCEAGAGLFESLIPGTHTAQIPDMNAAFAAWLADDKAVPPKHIQMQDFTPVRQIKNRHKCVLLTFEAAVASLKIK